MFSFSHPTIPCFFLTRTPSLLIHFLLHCFFLPLYPVFLSPHLLFFHFSSFCFSFIHFNPPFCLFSSLQLIASNTEGKSSPSEVLVCTTNPDKPGPPSKPCVTAVTPYGFTVTWGKDTRTDKRAYPQILQNAQKTPQVVVHQRL